MILTLASFVILLAGIIFLIIGEDGYGNMWGTGLIFTVCGGVCAFALVCAILFNPICTKAEIVKLEAVKTTLDLARQTKQISSLELVTIQREVIELNKWLASSQFWAKHKLTNWFWPKEIFTVKPIK